MSHIYYKFASELTFCNVNFDGLHISVMDLKKAIIHQKRLGKANDFDLQISNAQTKEEYKEDNCLIPKNTSLTIARIPLINQHKKSWEVTQTSSETSRTFAADANHDISKMNGTEEDKIQEMMMQSTLDYDPTTYQRVKGNQSGEIPSNYRCHKCHKPGHWIKNCPLNVPGKEFNYKSRPESKKMTGIPRSLRETVRNEPQEQQFVEEKREIPEEIICTICKGIFRDAVMVPCCGSSFCDECVRTALLESENSECPDCNEKDTSPGALIPNRFLRKSVSDFLAESSNTLSRDTLKKTTETEMIVEEPTHEEEEEEEISEEIDRNEIPEQFEEPLEMKSASASEEEEEDDDNITVTLPSAHQQCRGAAFRDSRMRRIPSYGIDSQSSIRSSQDEESENVTDNNSDNYSSRNIDNGSKRSNDRYSETPQGITSLGSDKNGNQNIYSMHSSSMNSHNDYPPQQQQSQVYQNQAMVQPMHQQSMYPQQQQQQSHYQQGHYYQHNQMRPMGGFEHQGNFQQHPMRHHQMHHSLMRPMNDNFGMRHQRPQNSLATAVSQDIQQRFGSGFIDDPLEAFNRIMREKEMRKERYRRSPQRHSPDSRRKNFVKLRKRSRSNGTKSISRSKSRSRSPRYRRKERRHNSRERRDDRRDYRSPNRRGGNQISNRKSRSRSKYKNESSRHGQTKENMEQHERDDQGFQHHHRDEQNLKANEFEVHHHNLDEQPPPPGEETIENTEIQPEILNAEKREENSEFQNSEAISKREKSDKTSKSDHHHKKSRHHDTPDDNKSSREKKKRKKSKEHEKKKSKKDKRDKKHSKSPENESKNEILTDEPNVNEENAINPIVTETEVDIEKSHTNFQDLNRDKETECPLNRSDSILDINSDEKIDDFYLQESKWDREDDKMSEKNEKCDEKLNVEEKVTHEVLKRAENVIFAKAIREIRPNETRKKDDSPNEDSSTSETKKQLKKSPVRGSIKSRLGVKVTDSSPRSRSKTPKRASHLQSTTRTSTKESRDRSPKRSTAAAAAVNSFVKISQDASKSKSRRSRSADRQKTVKREPTARSSRRSKSRDRRSPARQRKQSPEQTSSSRRREDDKKQVKSSRESETTSRSRNDAEKSSLKVSVQDDVPPAKRSRDSSSDSTSTTNSDEGKRHSKSKGKKKSRSRSPSDHNSSKRKKSKKEKKAKKKKKSKK